MSKAILVIDMPNNCSECPCFYDWLRCQAKDGLNVVGDERPNGCPLKPMPTKKWYYRDNYSNNEETDKKHEVLKKVYTMYGYFNGWDSCIDEILGE